MFRKRVGSVNSSRVEKQTNRLPLAGPKWSLEECFICKEPKRAETFPLKLCTAPKTFVCHTLPLYILYKFSTASNTNKYMTENIQVHVKDHLNETVRNTQFLENKHHKILSIFHICQSKFRLLMILSHLVLPGNYSKENLPFTATSNVWWKHPNVLSKFIWSYLCFTKKHWICMNAFVSQEWRNICQEFLSAKSHKLCSNLAIYYH